VNEVDTRNVLNAFPLTVTLDNLTAMAASSALLKAAGFVPEGESLNLALTLTDLEIVFDLLPTPAQRLHYLRRRNAVEGRLRLIGDELDLLALYTDTGFNLGSIEEEDGVLMVPGLSRDIDRYYIGRQMGMTTDKPVRRLEDLWLDLLRRIEERAFPGWLEISVLLLYAPYDIQRRIRAQLRKTVQAVHTGRLPPQFIIGTFGPSHDRKGLVFFAYRGLSRDERNAQASNGLANALAQDNVDMAVVLGFDTEIPVETYSFLSVGPQEKFGPVIQQYSEG
jgi:hypothetical protein